MDDQNDQVAQRDALSAAGRERWDASTRSGENLDASRPTDVVALGGVPGPSAPAAAADQDAAVGSAAASGQPETASSTPSGPLAKYVKAQPGDNIIRLVGDSDPAAIGAFARLNGMDGRSSTIYPGRVYAIPAGSDVASPEDPTLGGQLLQHDNARAAALRAQRAANDQFQARFGADQNVWTGQLVGASPPRRRPSPAAPLPSQGQPWWETAAKGGVGVAAYGLGALAGPAMAVGHAFGDVKDAGLFGLQWAGAFGPQAQAQANGEAADAAGGALRYARTAIDDPSKVVSDARDAASHAIDSMSPFNVDLSGSLGDVADHQFHHGRNFGEAATNVAGMFAGGELVQGLRAAGAFEATGPARIAKFIDQGANPKLAEYLAQRYPGGGHHSIFSRKFAKERNLPPWLVDSPINLAIPRGMSRGDFYEYHYRVDPAAKGFRLPADLNDGKGWRPKELGLTKYALPERIWKGTPVPLKDAMATIPFADAPTLYDQLEPPQ